MLFFGPLYNFLAERYATSINHFALVKLTFLALDKTFFLLSYFCGFTVDLASFCQKKTIN